MADAPGAPFEHALGTLREQLLTGEIKPGQRLAASVLAERLHSSATPIREALARLAGEGLLEERRGVGYFAPSLLGADIADLYRLSLAHLSLALQTDRAGSRTRPSFTSRDRLCAAIGDDPIGLVERLFSCAVEAAGSRSLALSYGRISVQLGPYRRREPDLFDDLADEATQLKSDMEVVPAANGLAAMRRFHRRRIAVAARLADAVGTPRSSGSNILPI